MENTMRTVLLVAAFAAALPLGAQQPTPPQGQMPAQQTPRAPAQPVAAQSTRATVWVYLTGRTIGGRWVPGAAGLAGPARILIEYGQPHLRGRRTMTPDLVPADSIWRLGANMATQLHTDVDMTIGSAFVPRGTYSMFALPTRAGWKLIINKQTMQWGTDYDPSMDLARVDLRARTLTDPMESMAIFLVPQAATNMGSSAGPAQGVMRIVWDRWELSTDWKVGR